MTRYPEIRTISALPAYLSTGTLVPAVFDPTKGPGLTLGAATYLFPLGGERYGSVVETAMHSFSAVWPSGVAGTMTIEATNFPKTSTSSDQGASDVTDWDTTTDSWQQINPTLAGAVYANANGTGTMTAYTCVITAGVGGAFWNVPDFGALRLRIKFVVTTGGFVRVFGHSKLGS
jgi:hypothetical protein